MKKFYSLVLMAAALLIGTNAWAQQGQIKIGQTVYSSLDAAFKAATDGAVIELVGGPVSDNLPAWFGETSATEGNARSIKLKLNGNTYLNSSSATVIISITRGKLEIVGPGKMQTTYGPKDSQDFIRVYGTYEHVDAKTQTPFAHLVIGEDVVIENYNTLEDASAEGSNVLTVDVLRPGVPNFAANTSATANTYPFDYSCDFYKKASGGWGVANGVKIEVYGKLNAKKYALKVNGCVREGKEAIAKLWKVSRQPKYTNATDSLLPASFVPAENDRDYSPYILIGNSAKLYTNNVKKSSSVALYSAGYSRIQIEGECEGSTGVYVKSGDVTLNNAIVSSNFDDPYQKATNLSSGVNGAGSALTMESNNTYAGGMDVTVQGDSKLTAENGYAIEENVPQTTAETKVEHITITGGTFVGGQVPDPANPGQTMQGTMVVSQVTAAAAADQTQETTITIIGAQATAGSEIGDQTLADYLSNQTDATHITYVENENGQQVMVISEGDAPDAPVEGNMISQQSEGASVKWTVNTKDTIKSSLKLAELEINTANLVQELVIKENATFEVGRVVLGKDAKIIVEAGAKFIVTGAQGIVAPVASNIVLQSSEAAQALFLFNPLVSSNREPNATVDMTVAKGINDMSEDVWTRFAMPVKELKEPWTKKQGFGTWLFTWDYEAQGGQGDWVAVAGGSTSMKPWIGYTLSYNSTGEEVYTFKGNLLGNNDAALKFVHEGYNFFGNSYSSYIDAKTLVNALADGHVDASIYMWDAANQVYGSATKDNLNNHANRLEPYQLDVAPMQTFILRLRGANNADESVNYSDAIWNNPRYGHSGSILAPRRRVEAATENTYFQVVITAANGKCDRVNLTEDGEFSDAYENGYDAAKFFNSGRMNVYASVEGEDYSDVVTNSLAGKVISMQTMEDVNYTLSFNHVEGNEYALLDKVTNKVIAIEEGAVYEFAAQPNSIIEGRFEIVEPAKMPTAIENTEAVKNAKGIYTLMGQYVGENFDILPVGVYVVNGVKVVK